MFAELLGTRGRATAAARAARCTSPTTRTATSARMRSSAARPGIATGAAFSAKRRGTDQVAVCFFGDGALGQGLLYEVMNMASLWALPVDLRLREQPLQRVHALPRGDGGRRSLDRPRAFGIETARGRRAGRPRGVRRGERARRRARARGGGPAFLLCNTYRYHGHHVGDVDRAYYRSKDEEAAVARPSAIRSRCTAGGSLEQGLADDGGAARGRRRGARGDRAGRRVRARRRRSPTRAR